MHHINLPSESSSLLDWAQFYASLNWPIIPLHSPDSNGKCSCKNTDCPSTGKHPRLRNGFKDASTDQRTITSWWNNWPEANIGIVTGIASKKVVIDIDPKNGGFESLIKWENDFGKLEGNQAKSGGDGIHFYYDLEENSELKNKVNLSPGIDIRANGGYIVAPPSHHQSGKRYEWNLTKFRPVDLPLWLHEKISNNKRDKKLHKLEVSQKIITGSRNNFLASMAGVMRKNGLNQDSLESGLTSINQNFCVPQLTNKEVHSVAKSIAKYSNHQKIEEEWNKPQKVQKNSYITPVMDESFIPDTFKSWIFDISKRMQVPYEFIAAPAIVGIGSVIGKKIGVYPKKNDNWLVIPNLWGGIVAGPGTFKSPAISSALRPIEKIIKDENELFNKKLKDWEIDKSINDATIEAVKEQLIRSIKKGDMDEAEVLKERLKKLKIEMDEGVPTCKRLKTNDATIEKISQILLENPNGILVLRDELAGWLASLNKYGRDGDREFYLEAWNGYGSYTVDRIGRGTTHIPSLCLSIFGGIQPDKLKKLLTSSLESNDDGLLQRFQILINPEIKGKWKNYDCSPDFKAEERVCQIFQNLHSLKISEEESECGLHFDEEAQELFNDWRAELEEKLRSGIIENPHYEAHLSKFRSLMPTLALIFQLLAEKSVGVTFDTKISLHAAKLAIKWCDYLNKHAKKIYQVNTYQYYNSIHSFISKVRDKKIKDGDNIRLIYRHGWQHLNTSEKIENTLTFLAEHNWLRIEEIKIGYRSSRLIKINPDIQSVL